MSTNLEAGTSWPVALAVPVLWIAWLIYWAASAGDVKATRVRQPLWLELLHRAPLIFAAMLMAAPRVLPQALTRRFLPVGGPLSLLGPILLAGGLGFAVWARRHLGRNWSTNVVVKEDHALIRTGPYRHVRHPIYTGLLLAFLGTALSIGEWRWLLAVPFLVMSFVLKSRQEERRMRETFPEYAEYQRETAALVPFVY